MVDHFQGLKCPYCGSEDMKCPSCGGTVRRGLTSTRPFVGARCASCGIPITGYVICGGCNREVRLQEM
jgi:hypothetical protein